MNSPVQPRMLGRYLCYAPIAAGGMATVYLARMAGPKGFSRIVAIKQLHAQLVHDVEFVTMFVDEAHLIGRIHHSNVVAPIDVVEADGDLCIVMEYVHGEALGRLMRLSRRDSIPLRVTSAILVQTLLGLHAAHELTDGDGQPLSAVHLDVSPQNILVGEDGITRVVDFGIAQAAHRARPTDPGKLKGKLGYMAPEQLMLGKLDRRSDIFSAGIILWEMLTGKKLLSAASPSEATEAMLAFEAKAPSLLVPTLSPEVDAIALKALTVDPEGRFATALEMARALESACLPAGAIEVTEWVRHLVADTLSMRARWIAELVNLDLGEWTQTYVVSSLPPGGTNTVPGVGIAESQLPAAAEVAPTRVAPPASAPGATEEQAANLKNAVGLTLLGPVLPWLRRSATVFVIAAFGLAVVSIAKWPRVAAPASRRQVAVMAASPFDLRSANTTTSAESPLVQPPVVSAVSVDAPQQPSFVSPAKPHSQAGRTAESGNQSDCKVPFVIDAKGIKRFRPECFRKR